MHLQSGVSSFAALLQIHRSRSYAGYLTFIPKQRCEDWRSTAIVLFRRAQTQDVNWLNSLVHWTLATTQGKKRQENSRALKNQRVRVVIKLHVSAPIKGRLTQTQLKWISYELTVLCHLKSKLAGTERNWRRKKTEKFLQAPIYWQRQTDDSS